MPPSRIRSSHIPKLKGHPTLLLASGNRLYPSLFGLKSKLAPPGGEHIKEYFFPEGTELGSCEYAFVRNEEVFGDDAEIFRPDRWIEASQGQKIKFRYRLIRSLRVASISVWGSTLRSSSCIRCSLR